MRDETTVRASRAALDKVLMAATATGFKITAKDAVNYALAYFADLIEGRDSDENLFVQTDVALYRIEPARRRQLNGVPSDQEPRKVERGSRSLRRTIVAKSADFDGPVEESAPRPDSAERYERYPVRPLPELLDRLRIAVDKREQEEAAMDAFERMLRRQRNAVGNIMAGRSPTDRQLVNGALEVAFLAVRDDLWRTDAPSDEQIAKAVAELRTGG